MFNVSLDEAKAHFSTLSFRGEKLVPDLYGRAQFTYIAEVQGDQTIALSGFFRMNKREFDLSEVDCLVEGPPPGFIKGQFLYFLETDIRYQALKNLPRLITPLELEKLLEGEVEVLVFGELTKDKPQLILRDKIGVTAELPDPKHEAELRLTHYQKRPGGWVCPSDKVFTSLSLLYAGGWEILTSHGEEVIPFEKLDLDWEADGEALELTGTIHFYGSTLPVQSLPKQRTVALEGQKIGLLPDNFKLFQFSEARLRPEEIGKLVDILGPQMLERPKGPFHPLQPVAAAPSFLGQLRPYQQQGLNWLWFLYQNGLSGLLADDMGLGKTVQTLALLSLLPGPILIVLPTTLKFNWLAEIRRFLPTRERDITLVSYTYLRQNINAFQHNSYEAILLDEAQAIKNRATDTFKAVAALKSRFRLSMTGTPVENSLTELVTHFKFLLPTLEIPEEPHSLKQLTAPFLLRRKKEEVLPDLPEKVEETVFIDLLPEQKICYERYLEDVKRGDLATKSRIEILEVILRLRQIACHPLLAGFEGVASAKMETALADIETLVQEGRKVILFSQFTSLLRLIGRALQHPYLYLDGDTKEREKVIHTFQQEAQPQLLLMSLKAGGVGLNLTRADTILLFDPWWNSAVEEQAIARAHRMGRQGTVFAKRYITQGTVEEKMEALKLSKKKLADHFTPMQGSIDENGFTANFDGANFTASELLSLL